MLGVLSMWSLFGPLFVGIGLWMSRALKSRSDALECFWLGVCATLAVLNAWNLFLPINAAAFIVFALVGAAGLLVERRRLFMSGGIVLGLLLVPAALWMSNRALGPILNWDTGVYHLPNTLWAHASRAVPGIGNLHPNFAVGHGTFLLGALFSNLAEPQQVTNGMPALAMFAFTLRGALSPSSPSRVAAALLLPWSLVMMMGRDVSSLSADLLQVALGAAVCCTWIESFENGEDREQRLNVAFVLALGLALVKMSGAGVAIGMFLAVPRLRFIAFGLVGVVPWCLGSIIRSGALVYPSSLVIFPTDWRMPKIAIQTLEQYTLAFGRGTFYRWDQPNDFAWVGPRIVQLFMDNAEFVVPFVIAVGALVVLFARARRPGISALVFAPLLVELLYWFWTSPENRAAGIWLQAIAAVTAAFALSRMQHKRAVVAVLLAITGLRIADLFHNGVGLGLAKEVAVVPTPAGKWVTTAAGATVFQTDDVYCWNAPLPCVTYADPKLESRAPDLGFRMRVDHETYRPETVKVYLKPTRPSPAP